MIPSDIQILKKARRTIEKYGLLEQNDKIIVAVSGGADSTCLLHILNSLKKDLNLSLHIAHLNHELRGKEAERDALFVKKLSESLHIPCTIKHKNISVLKKRLRASTQAIARTARLEFLLNLKEKKSATKIALGHTLDDRAETVLINLIKGSGTSGIAGMDFYNRQLRVIRPLMEITRNEVETYLKKKKISFVTDSSNLKKIYLRNKIRLELIPFIEKRFNPQIKKRIASAAEILSLEDDYLEAESEKLLQTALTEENIRGGTITLSINLIRTLPVPIIYRLIRKALWRLDKNGKDIKNLTFSHINSIFLLITEGSTGSYLNLPGRIRARKNYNELILSRSDKKRVHKVKETNLLAGGKTKLHSLNKTLITRIIPKNSIKFITKDTNLGIFDFQKIKNPLIVRARKKGDRFTPLGMKSRKKLKDYFIDRKIPKTKRDEIPLMVSNREIMWVIGERISENFKVTDSTKDVLLAAVF